jgi:mRNA interferase RelE/StbE
VTLAIELRPSAVKAFRALDRPTLRRVDAAILALAKEPYPPGSKQLAGVDDLHRVRVGDYRIVYRVEAARVVLLVIRIGHRREVYRGL